MRPSCRLRFALAVATALVGAKAFSGPPSSRIEISNAAQPQLASDAKGRVWLAYGRTIAAAGADANKAAGHGGGGGHGHGAPRPVGEIFIARSDDGGVTFGTGIKVARVPNLMLGNRRGPRVSVFGDRVTITVIGPELLAFTSSDAGRTWGEAVTVNDIPTSAREGLHDLAASPDGELLVTWLDLRNGTMELWAASSRDGRNWTKDQQVYRSPDKSICECCHPSALYDTDGNLAIMWRNSIEGSRDMWMVTRPKGAAGFSTARKLGEGTWKVNACPMDGGRIVALGGGTFGAVWQRNGEVYFSRGPGGEVTVGKGKQPVVLQRAGGSPVFVWQQGADLVLAKGLNSSSATAVKRVTDARFPVVVAAPGGKSALLAYEQGPKGATSVAVERL